MPHAHPLHSLVTLSLAPLGSLRHFFLDFDGFLCDLGSSDWVHGRLSFKWSFQMSLSWLDCIKTLGERPETSALSSQTIKDTGCQHNSSLVVLTWITGLSRTCPSFPCKVFFLLSILFLKVKKSSPHEESSNSTSLKRAT